MDAQRLASGLQIGQLLLVGAVSMLDLNDQSLSQLGSLDLVLQHHLWVNQAYLVLLLILLVKELDLLDLLFLGLLGRLWIHAQSSLSKHLLHLSIQIHGHLQVVPIVLTLALLGLFVKFGLLSAGLLSQSCSLSCLPIHEHAHLDGARLDQLIALLGQLRKLTLFLHFTVFHHLQLSRQLLKLI
jgi:hypothetical protein